jgi:hypothetical protein
MSPLATLAPDEQATWAPEWLLELDLGGGVIRRYAYTGDLDRLPAPYDGRLIAEPEVERGMTEELWGAVAIQDVTIELANARGALTADYVAGYQTRPVTLKRYDHVSGDLVTEFVGIVSRAALGRGMVRLDCRNVDKAALEELIPRALVTTALFPNARDVGAVIPVVFGNVPRVPIRNVNDDLVGSLFDYVVGAGTMSVTGLYRNGQNDTLHAIGFAECVRAAGGPATAWAEVARTDLYSGYTAVRFLLRQTDFNNSLHKIYADVTGLSAPRNFARAVRTVIQNTLWGLGRTANVANFAVAEALLDANLVCDGAMLEQRQAREWLSELLMVRGMRLGLDASGAWTIAVDTQATTRRLIAQDGTADGARTLLAVGERTGPTLDDTLKACVIRYRLDHITDRYLFEQRRTINASKGKDRVYEHHFLRSHEAADRVADYVGKRLTADQERVEVTLGQPARRLAEGEIVAVLDPTIGYPVATDLEVVSVRKSLTAIVAKLRGWAESIYTYTPGTLPTDNVAGTEADNSRTFPTAPTTPTLSASGTRVAGDGHVTAWVTLATTVVAANVASVRLRYRVSGTTAWIVGTTLSQTGAITGTIEGLLPATSYDYSATAVSPYGLASDSGTLASQVTPADATLPTAPSAIAVTQAGAKVIEIRTTIAAPADFGGVWLYRNTVNNSATATAIQFGKKTTFHDQDIAYATAYYYWTKVADTSGNLSGFSPGGGPITVVRIQTPDVEDGHITTPKLPVNAVSQTLYDTDAGSQGTTSTSYVSYSGVSVTLNVTSVDSLILVLVMGDVQVSQAGGVDGYAAGSLAVSIAGVDVAGADGWQWLPSGTPGMFPATVVHMDGPGRLGNVTYQVRFKSVLSGTTTTIFGPVIQVTELKR